MVFMHAAIILSLVKKNETVMKIPHVIVPVHSFTLRERISFRLFKNKTEQCNVKTEIYEMKIDS